MQCAHMNEIYSVDKKLIKKSQNDFINGDETAQKIRKNILRFGHGSWELGVDNYFTGKQWVFFNKKPSGCFKRQWEQYWLEQMGYYKYNKVGCGTCEICRTENSKRWAVKSAAENKCWKNAVFLTFTYNDQNLEVNNGFINKADLQKFWKDLRYHLYKDTIKNKKVNLKQEYEQMESVPEEIRNKYLLSKRQPKDKPIRYIAANEYGSKKGRAHAHAVVYNFMPADLRRWSRDRRGYYLYKSRKLDRLWGHGYVIVGLVNANAAAYVARYNTKKFSNQSGIVNETYQTLLAAYEKANNPEEKEKLKEQLQIWKRRRECISASSLGYIGSYYWEKYKQKIIKTGGIFVNWAKGVHLEKLPKTMEKQFEDEFPYEYEEYEMEKNMRGEQEWKKILSKTTLSEQEYIEDTYRQRMKKLKKLKREYDEKPTVQTVLENR